MWRMSILCLALLMGGCSSSTVVLNARYLSPEMTQQVTQLLQDNGFDVDVNTHAFPQRISDSTLVYSLMLEQQGDVDKLLNLIAALGWSVPSVQPLMNGNHWYKKNTLGVYLVPEGRRIHRFETQAELAQTYQSKDCPSAFQLVLGNNGAFELFRENTVVAGGRWSFRAFPYIELTPQGDEWPDYLHIQRQTIRDKISDVLVVTLAPVEAYPWLPACDFEYGERL
ncbi:hypothetical protein LJ739_11695 [Aestuariibacter halophilus]|uniref:Lipoprotein n=1 Tax=Fluctibacter halophilus TaxID=226011 RepID=A0ABS8G8K1_9ALTE|nr:hypothetical protein [Aestuariibacter halophilus]MCC2616904.1 hypothetical protein [Aestuariibacter halophilus]